MLEGGSSSSRSSLLSCEEADEDVEVDFEWRKAYLLHGYCTCVMQSTREPFSQWLEKRKIFHDEWRNHYFVVAWVWFKLALHLEFCCLLQTHLCAFCVSSYKGKTLFNVFILSDQFWIHCALLYLIPKVMSFFQKWFYGLRENKCWENIARASTPLWEPCIFSRLFNVGVGLKSNSRSGEVSRLWPCLPNAGLDKGLRPAKGLACEQPHAAKLPT